jgi:hypothetical protein
MTYPTINDIGHSNYPRHCYQCPVCGVKCRRIGRHVRNQHLIEVKAY